jgi:hypothetical protein
LIRNDSTLAVKLIDGTGGWNSGPGRRTLYTVDRHHDVELRIGGNNRAAGFVSDDAKRERDALPPVKVCIHALSKKKKKRRRVCIHAANYEFVYVGRGTITRDHQFITALLPPAGNHTQVVLKYFLFVYTWRTAQPRAYPPRAF